MTAAAKKLSSRPFHVKHHEEASISARELSDAVHRAIVARELSVLAASRLPWPYDEKAEWKVLCFLAGSTHELRRTATPDLFFLDAHRAILQAVLESTPNAPEELALQMARRIHGATEFVEGLAYKLTDAVFTWGEISRAVDRLLELRDRRELIEALERMTRGLRVESLDPEDVRRALRRIVE